MKQQKKIKEFLIIFFSKAPRDFFELRFFTARPHKPRKNNFFRYFRFNSLIRTSFVNKLNNLDQRNETYVEPREIPFKSVFTEESHE